MIPANSPPKFKFPIFLSLCLFQSTFYFHFVGIGHAHTYKNENNKKQKYHLHSSFNSNIFSPPIVW